MTGVLVLAALWVTGSAAAQDPAAPEPAWIDAAPGRPLRFPRDHFSHPGYAIEWWYLTGSVATADGHRLGYQFTLFRIGLRRQPAAPDSAWSAADLVMGHAAVTDLAAGRHRFAEVIHRASPLLGGFGEDPDAGDVIAWCAAAPGSPGQWNLGWNGAAFDLHLEDAAQGFTLDLHTRPARPPALHGGDGYSRKNPSGSAASHYYSFTRLHTEGSVGLDGRSLAVQGLSWMDHEFGSDQLDAQQVGWDWFSLQLDDGADLMLYVLRDEAGRVHFARGTWLDPAGTARDLGAADFRVTATGAWASPDGGARYPSGWKVELPWLGRELRVRPELDAQENVSRLLEGLRYWEGAVRVVDGEGRRIGAGYVELTGYGVGGRLPL